MQIRTLFAGFLAAALMVGLPILESAQAADAPAKAKAKKESNKETPAAEPAPAPAAATTPAAALAPAAASGAGAVAAGAVVAATAGASGAPDQAGLDKAVADAQAARKKAASVGGEWRDTGKMITDAEGAGKAGDFAKGIKLANEAQKQGELGYSQAMKEKGANFPAFMTKK